MSEKPKTTADSDSYINVTDASSYLESNGNGAWLDGVDEASWNQALRRAYAYIDAHFSFAGQSRVKNDDKP
jgi:hypothetical protein